MNRQHTDTRHPKQLLVEGDEDSRVLPFLLSRLGIAWQKPHPVNIQQFDGVEQLLEKDQILSVAKTKGLKSLGVIVDADEMPMTRWNTIRKEVVSLFPTISIDLQTTGEICQNADGLKFGVWIMPDNVSAGMLETFLRLCVPDQNNPLWQATEKHCDDSRKLHQKGFIDAHRDKSLIHSWLAVQNPPGQQLHTAIMTKTLSPDSGHSAAFLAWFRTLFDV